MTWVEAIGCAVLCASSAACEPEDDGLEVTGGVAAESGDTGDAPATEETGDPVADDTAQIDADGDVFLRNRVALDMDVTIRPLDPEAAPGCDEIAADPGALTSDVFAPGRVETLSPHEITAVWPHDPGEQQCYAVWIASDGLGARILFWWDGDPPPRVAPEDCCSDGPGILQLIPTPDGWSLHLIGDTRLVHTPADPG